MVIWSFLSFGHLVIWSLVSWSLFRPCRQVVWSLPRCPIAPMPHRRERCTGIQDWCLNRCSSKVHTTTPFIRTQKDKPTPLPPRTPCLDIHDCCHWLERSKTLQQKSGHKKDSNGTPKNACFLTKPCGRRLATKRLNLHG